MGELCDGLYQFESGAQALLARDQYDRRILQILDEAGRPITCDWAGCLVRTEDGWNAVHFDTGEVMWLVDLRDDELGLVAPVEEFHRQVTIQNRLIAGFRDVLGWLRS